MSNSASSTGQTYGGLGQLSKVVDQFNQRLFMDHDISLLEDLLDETFISHHFPSPMGNNRKQDFVEGMRGLFQSFPDIMVSISEQSEFEDKVFQYGFWEGNHRADFMGVAGYG